MTKVITYGTYDVFHVGHYNLLKNAKALGDYLIVGVTTAGYDEHRGKLNVKDSLITRIENVRKTGFADLIIVEEYEGQKIRDIQKYGVDIFTVGSDWVGKFDYLNEYCRVIYLPRTQGVSSTQIRNKQVSIIRMGIIGCGRIATRTLLESKYVSGVDVVSVYNPRIESAKRFAQENELPGYYDDFDKFCEEIDAVYIASPHLSHCDYARHALIKGKHVLCEKPMALTEHEAEELYALAHEKNLILLEAIKTAYAQGFDRLIALAKSGAIGSVKMVEACFTKLEVDRTQREFSIEAAGGSMTELGTYNLLPILKLLGTNYKDVRFTSYRENENSIDLFTSSEILYPNAVGHMKMGLGVKSEGELIISGTTGYIYVPAPWWKTSYFEVRRENTANTSKYFFPFVGDGLRYEITEFCRLIQEGGSESFLWASSESIAAAKLMELYRSGEKTIYIN